MDEKKTKNFFWPKFNSYNDANETLNNMTVCLFTLASVQALIGVLMQPTLLMDSFVIVGLSFLMSKFKSRLCAGLLMSTAMTMTNVSFANSVLIANGETPVGGSSLVMALIVMGLSICSLRATLFLNKKIKTIDPRVIKQTQQPAEKMAA